MMLEKPQQPFQVGSDPVWRRQSSLEISQSFGSVSAFRPQHVNYTAFKTCLRSGRYEAFPALLEKELMLLNQTYERHENGFSSKFKDLRKLDPSEQSTLSDLQDFCRDLGELRQFVVANFISIVKLCKKYRQRTEKVPNSIQIKASALLKEQSFFASDRLANLIALSEVLLADISGQRLNFRDPDAFCQHCKAPPKIPIMLTCTHKFCWRCICNSPNSIHCCPKCRKELPLDANSFQHVSMFPVMPVETFEVEDSSPRKSKRLLLVCVDGCRADMISESTTPVISELMMRGAFSLQCRTEGNGLCAPSWTSCLTGVWSNKHGVVSDDLDGETQLRRFPPFLARLRDDGTRVVAVSSWEGTEVLCGGCSDYTCMTNDDKDSVREVERLLVGADCPDVLVMVLEAVDVVGHNRGFGPEVPKYVAAMEQIDEQVGRLVAAVGARHLNEDWAVMVVSDHGGLCRDELPPDMQTQIEDCEASCAMPHYDGFKGVHVGCDRKEVVDSFCILAGGGAGSSQSEILPAPSLVDVAAICLEHFGVDQKLEWALDGNHRGVFDGAGPCSGREGIFSEMSADAAWMVSKRPRSRSGSSHGLGSKRPSLLCMIEESED